MKRIILQTIGLLFLSWQLSFAQDGSALKTFTTQPCLNCVPPYYTIVTGSPAISTDVGIGGSPQKPWYLTMPKSPTRINAVASDQSTNNNNTFVTLENGFKDDKIKVVASGFVPGVEYTLRYHVLSSRTLASTYGSSAILQVSTSGGFPVLLGTQTTNFTIGINTNIWVPASIKFTATASELVFTLSGSSPGNQTGYVNFDISMNPFDCIVPPAQVQLFRTSIETPFPCDKINLYNLIKSTTPLGCAPVWSATPGHVKGHMSIDVASHSDPSSAINYYAFYYAANCYNTDKSTAKVSITYIETQVSLKSHVATVDCIKKSTIDLTAQVNASPYKVRWFDNDEHQGFPIDNPTAAPIGTYFAFYYDQVNQCYSTDKATADAVFSVAGSTMCCNDPNDPSNQIILKFKAADIVAPAQTFDLTTSILPGYVLKSGEVFEWFINAAHVGTPITDPTKVGAGTYYLFVHDTVNGCYNTNNSTASVTVSKACNAGTAKVPLKNISNEIFCQEGEPPIILNNYVNGPVPAGCSVVWYTNSDHMGNSVTTANVAGGVYYAFFYDNFNNCFNSELSPLNFVSRQVALNCPEDGCTLSTGCPPTSISLTALHNGPVPPGTEVRWFKNTTHSGQQVSDPTKVSVAGDYYAFYYHLTKQCYNKSGLQNGGNDQANKKVTIVNGNCNGVTANIKVALQGAYETDGQGSIMHAKLQEYYEGLNGGGLLPINSPYGGTETCPEINNKTSKVGRVVDWVTVEIRSAANPALLLESQSLLLKPSGLVIGTEGGAPVFNNQNNPVVVVVKHRNHLPVMSNSIQNFSSGSIDYDFTIALSQAFNDGSALNQMVLVDGVWCLISGDASQNFSIDNQDISQTRNSYGEGIFDTYTRRDMNLNGVVDNTDMNIQRNRFNSGYFSILINY